VAPTVSDHAANDAGAPSSRLTACLYDGISRIACDDRELVVDLTSAPVAMGATLSRQLKLVSNGQKRITIQSVTTSGDSDFTIEPGEGDFQPVAIEPLFDFTFNVRFTATAAGPHSVTITLRTADPSEPPLVVMLKVVVAGQAICACVSNDGASVCRTLSAVDFGTVGIGLSSRKTIRIQACGTEPVTLTTVQLLNADTVPVFKAIGLPARGTVLAPNDPPLEATLSFTPAEAKEYSGQEGSAELVIGTSIQRVSIVLRGVGTEAACRLTPSTPTVDFGQGAVGSSSPRVLTLINAGRTDCSFPAAPMVTAGADAKFRVEAALPASLGPGQTARLTVVYEPKDLTGPDVGELAIPVASEAGASGSGSLIVALRGSPVAAPACQLQVSPGGSSASSRTLDFGGVELSRTKVLPILFKNVGTGPCSVSSVMIAPGASAGSYGLTPNVFHVVSKPPTVLPGDAAVVDVSFTPAALKDYGPPVSGGPGLFAINLLVQTSDVAFNGSECGSIAVGAPQTPGCMGWALAGQGVHEDLQLLPSDADFGSVTVGCRSAERYISLYNAGTTPVQVGDVRLAPASASFELVSGPVPFSIQPGSVEKLFVRYRPPDSGLHTTTLVVESNATAGGLRSLALRGRGTFDTHQVDSIAQSSVAKTDVLFVVANTASMAEELSSLAANAQAFMDVAQDFSSSFHVAVVTTDMIGTATPGQFLGSPKIITQGSQGGTQLASIFQSLSATGAPTNQGLAAVAAALASPLTIDPATNGGFLREEARLAVVVVSDEDDASSGSTEAYASLLGSLKRSTNQSMVTLSAIVGDAAPSTNSHGQPGCTSSAGDAAAGNRYRAAQQATGGQFYSVCSSDWAGLAQELGFEVFSDRRTFELSRWATGSGMEVWVNGTLVPATDWTYDAATNRITFAKAAIPPNRSTITVSYPTVCF
jgi:hypothetical protein